MSEEEWHTLAKEIFYIGIITGEERDKMDYSRREEPVLREHVINDWCKREGICKITSDLIKEALAYFNIPVEDWVKYGDVVVEMYELRDRPIVREYSILQPIKSMPNNLHSIL